MYIIPENYQNSGKLLNGMISTRNAVETCVLVPLVAFLELTFLPFKGYGMLVAMLVTLIPLLILTAVGIAGDSFTQRMSNIIKFYRRRRKLHFVRR